MQCPISASLPAFAVPVLIGDHEQLRPKPQSYHLEVASGRGYDLDLSAFERLATTPGFPRSTLQVQRRMRPDISRYGEGSICQDKFANMLQPCAMQFL
jgi:hypothetical protein